MIPPERLAETEWLSAYKQAGELSELQAEVERLQAREQELTEALRRIVKEARDHWEDIDSMEDDGDHVGMVRYEAAKASGKSFCADIAREALGKQGPR